MNEQETAAVTRIETLENRIEQLGLDLEREANLNRDAGETIARLERYQHMADFGTCAVDWPLMDQWEDELASGKRPE